MVPIVLSRLFTCDHGTFGLLDVRGFTFFTAEDEWLDNEPNVSCIPPGEYLLRLTTYHAKGYKTYEVTGVPNRSRILIHPGNTEEDTQGCILPGLSLGIMTVDRDEELGIRRRKLAVLQSRKAFEQFMKLLGGAKEVPFYVHPWAP